MQPVPSPPPAGVSPVESSPVAAARARLEGIDALTPVEQVDAYDAVHRLLQDALAAVEQEQHDRPRQQHAAPGAQPGRR